jgi:hypothetical protein
MLKIIPLSLENATNQGEEAFEVGIADVWKICCNIRSASSCVCVCVCLKKREEERKRGREKERERERDRLRSRLIEQDILQQISPFWWVLLHKILIVKFWIRPKKNFSIERDSIYSKLFSFFLKRKNIKFHWK